MNAQKVLNLVREGLQDGWINETDTAYAFVLQLEDRVRGDRRNHIEAMLNWLDSQGGAATPEAMKAACPFSTEVIHQAITEGLITIVSRGRGNPVEIAMTAEPSDWNADQRYEDDYDPLIPGDKTGPDLYEDDDHTNPARK